jgi:RES domain-containing protein
MLPAAELRQTLDSLYGLPFSGSLFRATHLLHLAGTPNPVFLYCEGASRSGGRYTPVGGAPCLYLADTHQTATVEANRALHTYAVSATERVPPIPPTVVYSVDAKLASVLDLCSAPARAALHTDEAELTGPWLVYTPPDLSPTQMLGQAVSESGRFAAIRYPSARVPGGVCFAVFRERLVGPSIIRLYDPDGRFVESLPG